MKKWRCTLCGYVHTGEEPPETCPICGADRSLFEEIPSAQPSEPAHASGEKGVPAAADWKCTVCGYIHKDAVAPDPCPVCGSAKDQFETVPGEAEPVTLAAKTPDEPVADSTATVEITGPAKAEKDVPFKEKWREILSRAITRHHVHPITVHIPNGVLPVSIIFLMGSIILGCPSLSTAALWNMVIVVLAMPAVLYTGYNDWQRRYGGNMTPVFRTKIVCGAIVMATSLILTLWLAVDSDLLAVASSGRRLFFFLCLVMLGAAVVAGLNGGKLVFTNREDK